MEHRVSLDCATKRITLRIEGDSEVVMVGERRDYFFNVISTRKAKKLERKECEVYIAFVTDFASAKLTVNDIRIVKDFRMSS